MRLVKRLPSALVLSKQRSLPEQIDVAPLTGNILDRLFETCDSAPFDAEDFEKVVPECLRFGVFAGFLGPFAAELDGVLADFVPREGHGSTQSWHGGQVIIIDRLANSTSLFISTTGPKFLPIALDRRSPSRYPGGSDCGVPRRSDLWPRIPAGWW